MLHTLQAKAREGEGQEAKRSRGQGVKRPRGQEAKSKHLPAVYELVNYQQNLPVLVKQHVLLDVIPAPCAR